MMGRMKGWGVLLAVAGGLLWPGLGGAAVESSQAPVQSPGTLSEGWGVTPYELRDLRHAEGEIAAVDLPNGRLMLREGGRHPAEYVIHRQETRVSDVRDRQFLVVEDLEAGQRVRVDFVEVKGRRFAQAILVEAPAAGRPLASIIAGELVVIDLRFRELLVKEPRPGLVPPDVTYRIQIPEGTPIRDARHGQPLRFEALRVGQWVTVEVERHPDGRLVATAFATSQWREGE